MNKLSKNELIQEIDTCLGRNDVSQKDFVILHSLKYLLENGYFPLVEVRKKTGTLPIKAASVELVTDPKREKEIKEEIKRMRMRAYE